jgi:hypothetical protein
MGKDDTGDAAADDADLRAGMLCAGQNVLEVNLHEEWLATNYTSANA